MAANIIDRLEQKYYLSDNQYKELISMLDGKISKDLYFDEEICNVYFDNDNYELITTSIEKPKYKEKVRLRSYNKPNKDTIVFLEIKKKYNEFGNKRRIEIRYEDAINYIENGVIPKCNMQIMKEIDYTFKKYKLKPKISVTYDRRAYYLNEDENVRITFDKDLRYDKGNKYLDDLKDGERVMDSGYIMEIKTFSGLPLWFNKILGDLNIYPISFSKIGKIYIKIKESEI